MTSMGSSSWTIKDLLKVSTDYLAQKEIENPRLNAEVLLAHQLGIDRVGLYLGFDKPLNENEVSGFRNLIRRRLRREPLQYITGVQEFWSIEFVVNPGVLIPRPETELLVEKACEIMAPKGYPLEQPPLRILDLGTGCGAIAVSVAKEIENSRIWATDQSAKALKSARLNAERQKVSDRIHFLEGNLWEPVAEKGLLFDMILSNPPYVASKEIEGLPCEVSQFEPRLALDGGEEGMYYIERIIEGATEFMDRGAWLIMEMSPDQIEKALHLVQQSGCYQRNMRIKDYSHRYRAVMAQAL